MLRAVTFATAVLLLAVGAWAEDEAPADRTRVPVELKVQVGAATLIESVAFSPDGRHVLVGRSDKAARLWETATGREVRTFGDHEGVVWAVDFSPDGVHVLTASGNTAFLWVAATGRQVRRFEGHAKHVRAAAFSPNGAQVLTGSEDGTARLFSTATGTQVRQFKGHTAAITSVAFSSDGTQVLTGSEDNTARLWEAATGREVRTLSGHTQGVTSVAFSPDAAQVATASNDHTVRLWETHTGREIRVLKGHTDIVSSLSFSPDGSQLVTGGWDNAIRIWAVATGREIRTIDDHAHIVRAVAFSPDGAQVLSAAWDFSVRLWKASDGTLQRRFEGRSAPVSSVAFSHDGTYAIAGSHDRTAQFWLPWSGRAEGTLGPHGREVNAVALGPVGLLAMTGSSDTTARLWNTATGELAGWFEGHKESVLAVAFSPDGKHVLTGDEDKNAWLWDTHSTKKVRAFEGHTKAVRAVTFSPDGTKVLTGSEDGTARLWEKDTGRELGVLRGHEGAVTSAVFSPDGAQVLTGGRDDTARLWDASTAQEIRRFEGHEARVLSVAFAPDGTAVVTASGDGTLRQWDATSGKTIRVLEGHQADVTSVAYSDDGRFLLSGSMDQTTRLWDAARGRELCARVWFKDGSWVVFDPEGRYDASNGGDVEGAYFVAGMETLALSQLKERAYDPGLWTKRLGQSDEPLLDVGGFGGIELFPSVAVAEPNADGALEIDLTNRGGGIGRVTVLINGKEIQADARGASFDADAKKASLKIDLRNHPSIKPGEENTIEVVSWNKDGYLSSPRGAMVRWKAKGASRTDPPQLWAIVCGVSDYRGESLDLKFAAKDAEDFASALTLGASALFGAERTHVRILSTSGAEGTTRPTRKGIEEAFAWAKAAKPDDLLIVYLAGHGVSRDGKEGDFHYLLESAASDDLADPEVRRKNSISSREMTDLIKAIPATKRQVMILDTCASGRLIDELTEKRNVPGSQVRALDRVKDRTGMFVLAGCAADRVSFEASKYGQGLLTYSLLLGMRGGALREDEFVDIEKLFGFAADRVPDLAKDIGGLQRPIIASPKGGSSFDIGRIPTDRRADIPLQTVKPVFVRPTFTDRRARVVHKLVEATNAVLRDETAIRGRAPLVFVDVSRMPDAYELSGQYTVNDGTATVKGNVWRGEEEIASFEVSGAADDIDALARAIVTKAREGIAR